MYLAPIAVKAETKIAEGARVLTKQLDNVNGALRKDGRNATPIVKKVPVYFAPTTPINEHIAPKNCANDIDFRF